MGNIVPMADRLDQDLVAALALVAPGSPLREGLDRVLQAKRGALVVIGDDAAVLSICSGGFLLDAEFSPQRLSELAKMDGAIILARDASRIARANVHLVPAASIPTSETGTRHRTAERVARSIGVPVVAVSESMSIIAIYRNGHKHTVQPPSPILDRAGQALSTLQRFRNRFDLALATLSTLEVEDAVAVRDVVAVIQPGELVGRIAEEVQGYLVELGEDGRLVRLQLEELTGGVQEALRLVVRDYVAVGGADGAHDGASAPRPSPVPSPRSGHSSSPHPTHGGQPAVDGDVDAGLHALATLPPDDLLDPLRVGETLGLGTGLSGLDAGIEARGYRLLHRLPRFSDVLIERVVERFVTLPHIMQASLSDLEKVGGVGEAKARAMKDGLARLAEASILARYE